ncbi:uroporphyrinogen-III synthase [Roseibium sp.]|uniref:uroporphyrinogen-III synthase n=1 Tax=Roseibium sp. TaxID=1936156 RepID=UPI003263DB1A
MRFLVTRPQPDCRRTADRLRAAGHVADEAPLLVTRETLPDHLDLSGVTALAVSSRRTVAVLETHPQIGALRALPVYSVGDATAAVCRNAGFADVLSAQGDVGALADLVLRSQASNDAGVVLYPAAADRAGDLEGRLAAGNVSCRAVSVYRMDPAGALPPDVLDLLLRGACDGVLIYSKRTAETLNDLVRFHGLGHIFSGLQGYALSSQAAAPLSGILPLKTAAAPNEDALLELVLTRS